MKKPVTVLVAVVLLVVLTLTALGAGVGPHARTIGAGRVAFGDEHLREGTAEISAFIRTDSDSAVCLVTLAESNFAVSGTTTYCGIRRVSGKPGIFVHIFLPHTLPAGLFISATVYQDRAKFYESPVLFTPP